MKKKILIALVAVTGFSMNTAHAQLRKVPAEVTNNFSGKFPDATNVEWQERIIKLDYLPKAVKKGFSKGEYGKWEIREVTILETPENKSQYKITVAKNNINKKDLLFNADGQLVKDNFTF